jgi:hypothetical protein
MHLLNKSSISVITLFIFLCSLKLNAQSQPKIPIGLDAYKMWELWPMQRLGVRAYMRSTYDRKGGNESADASHFLFVNEETDNVSLDVKGSGVLYFFRTNHWHGSPWHFVIDGHDNLVSETGTAEPNIAKSKLRMSSFIPESAFPRSLNWTWEVTKGADLIWTPMPFENSLRISYSRTCYGTGYYIYHLYANEKILSQPIKSFQLRQVPGKDVLSLLDSAGFDIAPKNITIEKGNLKLDRPRVKITKIETKTAQQIRALKFTLPLNQGLDLERIRLIATWDGAEHPSIDAPLSLFYGAGTFYNREEKEYLVKGLPLNIRFDYINNTIELGCYFPMPFNKSAEFELSGINPSEATVGFEVRYEPLQIPLQYAAYFHATYKDVPIPEFGKDMVYLDTKGIEGHTEWSGHFVGNSFIFSHQGNLTTLEGDPRFYFDDSKTPQAYGTGTEEWGGGGDYWGGQNMTLPLVGHPCGTAEKLKAKHPRDLIESAYRFLLADIMPFGKRAIITFEHGGENLISEHYESVCYWYGVPKPTLVLTDELNVGNTTSEKLHKYLSPESSKPYLLTSRFEMGIDRFPEEPWRIKAHELPPNYEQLKNMEIFPAETLDGRYTRGTSEFTIKIIPDNKGVLLRRTLDYSFPNQTAEVFVADESSAKIGKWERVGLWYLAGSNTNLYSNPPGELDLRFLKPQTSNRQLRDDEFVIPEYLTKGKSNLQIKLRYIPNTQQLFPGTPFPNASAWSELDYKIYSFVIPK